MQPYRTSRKTRLNLHPTLAVSAIAIALAGPGLAQRDDAAASRPEIVELLTGKVVYDDGSPAVACSLAAKGSYAAPGVREEWLPLETEGPRADGTFVVRGPRGVTDVAVVPSYGDGYCDWKAPYGRVWDFYRKPINVGPAPGSLQGRVLLAGLPPDAVEIVYERFTEPRAMRGPRAVVRPNLAGFFAFRALPPGAGRVAVRLHGAVRKRLDLLVVDDVTIPRHGADVALPDLDLSGRFVHARIEVRDADGRPVDGVTAAVHADDAALRDEAVVFAVKDGVADAFAPAFPFSVFYKPRDGDVATWFADSFRCEGPAATHTLRPRCVLRAAAVEDDDLAKAGVRLVPELTSNAKIPMAGFPSTIAAAPTEAGGSLLRVAYAGDYAVRWRLITKVGAPLGDDAVWTDSENVFVNGRTADAPLTVRPSPALLAKARARAAR
jgi:hypothetical protein